MIRKHFSLFLWAFYSLLGIFFLSWNADDTVRTLRYAVQYVLSPLAEPPLAALDQLGEFGRNVRRLIDLDLTYRRLESQGLLTTLDRLRQESVQAENDRLTELLHVEPVPHFKPLVARVWGREIVGGFQSLTIRLGERNGVRPADPVVVLQDGRATLVGQVAEVYRDTSRVLLLTDPTSAVSAVVPRTGEQGAAEGAGPSRLLLNYLLSDTSVQPGDEVVTAGLGELFPPGIFVGTVRALEAPGIESFRRALIAPAARVGRLSEVMVLRRVEPAGQEKKS